MPPAFSRRDRPVAGRRQQEGQLSGSTRRPSPSIRRQCEALPTAPDRATHGWPRRACRISIRLGLPRICTQGRVIGQAAEPAPGAYTVILEPEAVADLLVFLLFSLNAPHADEGRSFLSKPGGGNRLGEKLFADGVTLRFDPFNPRNPGTPWAAFGGRGGRGGGGSGGEPAQTTWIENGVVKSLTVDRYWAKKTNVPSVPLSGGMTLEGSEKSLETLIAETPRHCSSPASGTSARSTRRTRWSPV